ncbi:MAG TPA: hypothetical protein VFV28_10535, partial [Limnobacter sp.]|nr:hypothetical protein [Limnobacter sp.]
MFQPRHRSMSLSFDSHRNKSSFAARLGKFLFIVLLLGVAAGLTLFSVSSCQEKAASTRVLTFASRNACELRYEGVGLTLIENHCGANTGI